ncbi:twin-arginine translocation pathway signal [Mycobacterium sp. CBMA 234]|uniref:DUF1906 domain-containing protein n=1 Tax=Mycolicibacterium sp. CBMA 234 TaxID=1918495 RepID=UPI0012DDFFFF|nr:DUF1906 domain-containing protein [Mycolicibacterium sp. CBMA 234]MUL64991.1 twin-arginine translocation pathway signal [Mycolicibacterium sp. CBMA 234]
MADSARPADHLSRRGFLTVTAAGLAASLTAPIALADNGKLIDFTHLQVPVDQVAAAGYTGVIVYVSELRPGATFDFKPVTRGYADAARAAGLHVVSVYQYGKPGWVNSPSDFTRGFDGGVADAQTALRLHGAAGGPDTAPIFFSVDEDISADTWKNVALQWFKGINSVLGVARTGIYGGARQVTWASDDDVIGHSTTPGRRWAWQTRAWSGGARAPMAVLYQSTVVTASDPGSMIGDIHVDEDDILAADYGQWDLPR